MAYWANPLLSAESTQCIAAFARLCLTLTMRAGSYTLFCSFAEARGKGDEATLVVN